MINKTLIKNGAKRWKTMIQLNKMATRIEALNLSPLNTFYCLRRRGLRDQWILSEQSDEKDEKQHKHFSNMKSPSSDPISGVNY